MVKYKVVLVPFPFDDFLGKKVRPAVCLTNEIGPYQHVILAFITSRIPDTINETDIIIESTDPDFALAGLRVSSTLQLHRLMTISKSMLLRELGELSPTMIQKVHDRLHILFELG
jgi:mRNA interferase MazF